MVKGVLRGWILNKASYVMPATLTNPTRQLTRQELPIFADLPYLHVDVIQFSMQGCLAHQYKRCDNFLFTNVHFNTVDIEGIGLARRFDSYIALQI